MKSVNWKLLAAALCLMLLCGCGANNGGANNPGDENTPPSADSTQQENPSGNTAPDENNDEQNTAPEVKEDPTVLLTDAELEEWESYFNTMEHNGLLRFPYSDPAEDPDQLAPYLAWLFYDIGDTESEFSEDELALLAKTDLWLELDAHRLSRDYMNRYLYEHFNISAEKTENLFDAAKLGVYLLEYDAWYMSHGDTEYSFYEFDHGERYEDGTVKLYYAKNFLRVVQDNGEMDYIDENMVITLVPREDGTWYIVSHEIDRSVWNAQ